MSTPEIIPWPEKPANYVPALDHGYERQRAEAAISRLRVAVEALDRMAHGDRPEIAKDALASIGELKGEI